jgi:dTDP-4-amino-4,6-dideoxygalactose transaminase
VTLAENSTAPVPFLDLSHVHAPVKERILADIADLIDRSAFVNGPAVVAFEEAFAAFCGTRVSVGLASGLDALRLGLIAGGIGPGDEVVLPANTFIATAEAVSQAGATPVLADVTERDYNIDPDDVDAAVTSRTRALLPVHLYGQLADMRALCALAADHGLDVYEDACQAHGAERDGLRAGAIGRAAAFSFYPGKNLGAMGDAGGLTTSDEALAETVRALREHGQRAKYEHDLLGYTSRMDAIQAIVLTHKLALLGDANEHRRRVAAAYGELLEGVGDLRLPPVPAGSAPVWHVYPVRTADPAALAASLRDRGIASGRHYPQPVHLAPAYAHLGHGRGDFPVAEALAEELISLPIFPGMSDAQVASVAHGVREHFAG